MKRFLLSILVCLLLTGCTTTSLTNLAENHTASATAKPEITPAPVPTPAPIDFTFDSAKLPAEHSALLEQTGGLNDWKALTNAIFEQKSSCSLTNPDAAADLLKVFSASPYSGLADINCEGDTLYITYLDTGTYAELEIAVVKLMTNTVSASSNELETALSLYKAVASSFTFEENDENSLYRMLVEKKGGSKEFATVLEYLLAQADITAFVAEGTLEDTPHHWVVAEFDGVIYHLDPVFEQSVTGGVGLTYFGMSDTAHHEAGCSKSYTVGVLAEQHDSLCPNAYQDGVFTDVVCWESDPITHELILSYAGSDHPVTIKTEN